MKTIATEKRDNALNMSRSQVIEALYSFLRLTDFEDETSDMCLPLDSNVVVLGYYKQEASLRLMFMMCCRNAHTLQMNEYQITVGSLSDNDLRTVVDYLNLRLDAKGS